MKAQLDKLIKMRKGIILLLTLVVLVSCKNNTEESKSIDTDSPEKTEKQSDGLTLLKGEFVLFDDAAILQTHREFYGVYINDTLSAQDKQFKIDHPLAELSKNYYLRHFLHLIQGHLPHKI